MKSFHKRLLAVLLAALLVPAAALLPLTASAATTTLQITGLSNADMVVGATEAGTVTQDYSYSDDFFSSDSNIYNNELALLSLGMEWSSWGLAASTSTSPSVQVNAANLIKFYADAGFADAEYFDYDKSLLDERDRTAFSIAEKTLADGSVLLAVPIRGGNYGGEWVSNSNIGTGLNHAGFNAAADIVVQKVQERVAAIGAGRVKLWLTGFSRAAATANLAAAKLVDWANSTGTLARTDIFAYTFATPLNTTDANARDAGYDNIFNIVNPVDIVPIVPLGSWGFSRYGVDKYLQFLSANEADYAALNASFASLFEGKYTGEFPSHLATWEQFIAIYDVAYLAGQLVPTRADYNSKLQSYAANALHKFVDGTIFDLSDYKGLFLAIFGQEQNGFWNVTHTTVSAAATLLSPLWDISSQVDLASFVFCAGSLLLGSVTAPTVDDVFAWLDSLYLVGGTNIFAFADFKNNFIVAHTPESYYTLLKRGGGAEGAVFGSGTIKNIRLDGASSAKLIDGGGNVVAQIDGNTVTSNPLPAYNSNARKYFYLPAESSYTLEFTTDTTGKLSLSIDTLDATAYKTRQAAYYDVATASSKLWSAAIPAGAASYTLGDGSTSLSPSYDSQNVAAGHVHSYGAWIISRQSTGGELGEEYRSCSGCGKREYRSFLVDPTPTTIWGKIEAFFKRIWDWLVWFFTGGMFK
jgi:hypothetical protein